MGTKTCTRCKKKKALENFHVNKRQQLGRDTQCKSCINEKKREYYRTHGRTSGYNPSKSALKRAKLRDRYGLDLEDYEKMAKDQEGCCAVCGRHESESRLCVDHCHNTGTVRGLLCTSCNRGIGYLRDGVTVMQAAIQYLEGSNDEWVQGR